jgi:hypothetical protein
MQIQNDIIMKDDGVLDGVVHAAKAMELERTEDFTHYDEGSPQHLSCRRCIQPPARLVFG